MPFLTEDEWRRRLAEIRPESGLPGFWDTVATNATQWAEEVSVGPFWTAAKDRLDQWRSEFKQKTKADLLTQPGLPKFLAKSAESTRRKLFRRCRSNPALTDKALAPTGAPIPRIGDLVRTRIVCRYIDGVEFLASKLQGLAQETGVDHERHREGRLEGYFAQHVIVEVPVIFRLAGEPVLTNVRCEVQVASTAMADPLDQLKMVTVDSEGRLKPDARLELKLTPALRGERCVAKKPGTRGD